MGDRLHDSIMSLWFLVSKCFACGLKGCQLEKIWVRMEDLFRSNKESWAMRLDTELRTITMGDMSASDYFSKIKTLADQLENL